MIDLRQETPISLAQAARRLPPNRRGRPVTLSCLLRWVLGGVKTPNGVVKLEAIRLGGRWLTSVEALQRFAERQTPDPDETPQAPQTSAARRRAARQADAELQQIGL